MRNPFKLHSEKGYVLVLVSISLSSLLALFTLVADLGHIFVTKAELQNTSDAAALAAAVDLAEGEDIAAAKAFEFGEAHWVAGAPIQIAQADVQFGNYDSGTSTFVADAQPVNSVSVTARRTANSPSGALPLYFAKLFGIDTSDVSAASVAVLDNQVVGVKKKGGLIPYSVVDFEVDKDGDGLFDVGQTYNFHPTKEAPGNFGFLDFNGGPNATPELEDWIELGYDADFTIPAGGSVSIPGNPGINGGSLLDSFSYIIDKIVFMPVHNSVNFGGSNAMFNVVAVLAVKIKEVQLTGKQEERYIKTEILEVVSSVLMTDSQAPANNSVAKPRLVV